MTFQQPQVMRRCMARLLCHNLWISKAKCHLLLLKRVTDLSGCTSSYYHISWKYHYVESLKLTSECPLCFCNVKACPVFCQYNHWLKHGVVDHSCFELFSTVQSVKQHSLSERPWPLSLSLERTVWKEHSSKWNNSLLKAAVFKSKQTWQPLVEYQFSSWVS